MCLAATLGRDPPPLWDAAAECPPVSRIPPLAWASQVRQAERAADEAAAAVEEELTSLRSQLERAQQAQAAVADEAAAAAGELLGTALCHAGRAKGQGPSGASHAGGETDGLAWPVWAQRGTACRSATRCDPAAALSEQRPGCPCATTIQATG